MRSEVSSKMTIPKIINVGFQKRDDTYTKKLAYVVYTDAKGVIRKETSWNGWRDTKISPVVLDNVPTTGFVLNRKVGGYRHSWNHRNTYVRVYDPRDFEFEISVSNLLFILQETSSIQGKGLEGSFVYAWDGKDLVLLPTACEEYKECADFTQKQTSKVTRNEIVEGCSYLMKDMTNVMYLGRLPWAESQGWGKYADYIPVGLRHIFLKLDASKKTKEYIALTGYTKLAEKTSEQPLEDFADEYTAFKGSKYCRVGQGIEIEPMRITAEYIQESYYGRALIKDGDQYRPATIRAKYRYHHWGPSDSENRYDVEVGELFTPVFKDGACTIPRVEDRRAGKTHMGRTIGELSKIEFYTIYLKTTNGRVDIVKIS